MVKRKSKKVRQLRVGEFDVHFTYDTNKRLEIIESRLGIHRMKIDALEALLKKQKTKKGDK